MKAVVYYLVLPFLYLFMLIPIPFFYVFCDVVYFLVYHVIGYRRKVVAQNLRNAFPEKSDKEIAKISRRYYRHLCDIFLETFKTLTIRKSTFLKRCKISPQAKILFDDYFQKKKSMIAVMGHYGNWEWAVNSFSATCDHQLYVIYHPLSNKYFNGIMRKIRTRFGSKLVSMNDTFKEVIRQKNEINVFAFAADQTPSPENAYWTKFMNQDTPVFWGTERIARKMNDPVVYISVQKTKRGHYEIFAETLFENPKDTQEGEISEAHTRRLEKDIIEHPELWLWSHRRWKHSRKK